MRHFSKSPHRVSRVQFSRLTVLVLFFATITACAGGAPSDHDAQLSDTEDAGPDISEPTDATDVPQDTGADTADADEDACGVCCPGERSCVSEAAIGVCADDGSEVTEQACGEGQICEQGSCVDEPVCTPGETKCHDGGSRLVCRPAGTGWRTEACATGESCLGGECVPGEPNGAECSADSDCAGGKCRCGSDESCSPSASRTYCTATCTPGSCGPDEICVASSEFNGASYDHCVPECDETCALTGLSCVTLPTRDTGALTYEEGCYFDSAVDVGEECASAGECTGGTCLEGYFDTGLCTFECSDNCPEGTACVELEAGTYHCTPLCGDGTVGGGGTCPLEGGGDRWDVQCAPRSTYGGAAKRVCVST